MAEQEREEPRELEGLRGDLASLKHEEISSEEDEILAEISRAKQEIENNPEKFEEILTSLDADAVLLKRILEEKKKFWGLGEKISSITVDKIQNEKWKKVLKIGAKVGGGIIASRLIATGVKSAFNVSNPVTGAISGAAMGGFWGYVRGKNKTESADAWMKELNIEELEIDNIDNYSDEDLEKAIGILKNAIEDGKNGRIRGNTVSKINLARKYRIAKNEFSRRISEEQQGESDSTIDELNQNAEIEGKAISEFSGREYEELYKMLTERNKYTVVKEGIKGALVGAGVGYVANWAMDKIFHVDGNSAKDAALEAKKESIRQAHDAKLEQFGNSDLHSFNTDQTAHLQLVETKGDLHGFNNAEMSHFTESVNKSNNVWDLIKLSDSDLHNIDLHASIDGETGKNIGQFILEHKEAFTNLDPSVQREILSFPSLAEDIFKAVTENSAASASAISGNALGTLGLAAIGSGGVYTLAAKKEKAANEKIEAYEPRQQAASGGGDSGPDGAPAPNAGGTSGQIPPIVIPPGIFDDSNLGEGGLAENNGVNPVGLVESKPIDVEKYRPTDEDYKKAEEFWNSKSGNEGDYIHSWIPCFVESGKIDISTGQNKLEESEPNAQEIAAIKIELFKQGYGIENLRSEHEKGEYFVRGEVVNLSGGANNSNKNGLTENATVEPIKQQNLEITEEEIKNSFDKGAEWVPAEIGKGVFAQAVEHDGDNIINKETVKPLKAREGDVYKILEIAGSKNLDSNFLVIQNQRGETYKLHIRSLMQGFKPKNISEKYDPIQQGKVLEKYEEWTEEYVKEHENIKPSHTSEDESDNTSTVSVEEQLLKEDVESETKELEKLDLEYEGQIKTIEKGQNWQPKDRKQLSRIITKIKKDNGQYAIDFELSNGQNYSETRREIDWAEFFVKKVRLKESKKAISDKFVSTNEDVAKENILESESAQKSPEKQLREIIDNPDLPFYIQTRLNEGETLLNHPQTSHDGGFESFYLNRDKMSEFFPEHVTPSKQDLFSRSHMLFDKLQQISSNSNCSLRVVSLINLDNSGSSAIGIDFKTTKKDYVGREGHATLFCILPAEKALEMVEMIKKINPNEALLLIQNRISPDFVNIAPPENFTELDYGQLVLGPGKDWQKLNVNDMEIDTIKLVDYTKSS